MQTSLATMLRRWIARHSYDVLTPEEATTFGEIADTLDEQAAEIQRLREAINHLAATAIHTKQEMSYVATSDLTNAAKAAGGEL